MKTQQKKVKAILSLLTSAVIIGFSYVFVKIALTSASTSAILLDRLLLAGFALILLKKTGIIDIENLKKRQKFQLFLLAQLYPITFFLFQNMGIKYVTTTEASIVYALIPIFTTVVAAIILKERTTKFQYLGIVLSFCGISYLSIRSFESFSDNSMGYLFLFCSMLSMVFYYVILRKTINNLPPISIAYYLIMFALPTSFILYLFLGGVDYQVLMDLHRFSNYSYIAAIFYLSLLSTLLTSLLTSIGIKNLSAAQASLFSNVSPIFGILAGILFMNDILQFDQVIATLCIFIGVFISLKK
ncbi:DMT family transporter [Sphingobacterium sp. LRF_L2]|uniref:DMT family transporter n=1 Tax=Sphingobacterium sp. LRF_L2 TaxID=3369421 RepID=UPI003F63DBC1